MNAAHSPRRSSPSAPASLAGGPEKVAGNGSSPAGDGCPLAGKRVIDNSNTSGHEPQHARQLFGFSGDGGRSRVGDGGRSRVFAGRSRVFDTEATYRAIHSPHFPPGAQHPHTRGGPVGTRHLAPPKTRQGAPP
jgi:hypothetical protein